jgi:cohesin domain-containing protein
MKRTSSRSALFVLALIATGCANSLAAQQAQEATSSGPSANVVLGGTSGSPGESVTVPIYLSPPGGKAVGRIKLEVTFVSVNLKYVKTEPGIAADMGNVEVKSESVSGKNDKNLETTTVIVSAAAPSGGDGEKGIPPGLIAYINMRINESGRPATIALQTKLQATEFGTEKTLEQMKSADAEVEVVAPGTEPVVACFFFTH